MRWFKHEADARNSLKLRKLRRKYGADGYAIYWFCLEAIAYDIDKDNLTFELKEDAETIGFELSIQEKRVEEIMLYMIEIGLFESSRNTITCLKMAERLDKTMTNSPRMRAWLDNKNVMTSGDSLRHDATLDELDKEVEVEVDKKKIKNKRLVSQKLDFSKFPSMPNDDLLKDWKALRSKLKAPISQTVINRVGKELTKAVEMGFTVDQCFEQWIVKGWKGFEAEWMRNSTKQAKSPHNLSGINYQEGDL